MAKIAQRPFVGLALGGGGARGLAHIGVLKVFEQEKVPIDCLAGSSMGGLIAAAYAAGLTPGELEAEALELSRLRNLIKLVNLVHPNRGLLDPEEIRKFLIEKIGAAVSLEELAIPLGLTAVDLDKAEEIVLQSGSLTDGVLATIAAPGLFMPFESHGRRLVDGGVLNNVPADIPRQFGAEVVIACDVGMVFERGESWEGSLLPPPFSALIPRVVIDMYQAGTIIVTEVTRTRLAHARPDITIRPELGADITILSGFTRAAEVIAAGELAARAAVPKIRDLIHPNIGTGVKRLIFGRGKFTNRAGK